jgi:hypothetical protein
LIALSGSLGKSLGLSRKKSLSRLSELKLRALKIQANPFSTPIRKTLEKSLLKPRNFCSIEKAAQVERLFSEDRSCGCPIALPFFVARWSTRWPPAS